MSYVVGSIILYRHTHYIVERFIPTEKVPTKCRLQDRGPRYNLYVVRNQDQPKKSAFAWEYELDAENNVESSAPQESVAHTQ